MKRNGNGGNGQPTLGPEVIRQLDVTIEGSERFYVVDLRTGAYMRLSEYDRQKAEIILQRVGILAFLILRFTGWALKQIERSVDWLARQRQK